MGAGADRDSFFSGCCAKSVWPLFVPIVFVHSKGMCLSFCLPLCEAICRMGL